jgi:prepilin-type N-terminal cleavage/methylation domain-containing protein
VKFRSNSRIRLRDNQGMTLVELLVAMAIGMAMIAMTWTTFVRMKSASARSVALVQLHATAATLQWALDQDFSYMAPTLACFARSYAAHPGPDVRTETAEIVLMCTLSPLNKLNEVPGTFDYYLADYHWVRWRFTRTLVQRNGAWCFDGGRLTRSSSTPTRAWKTNASLVPPLPIKDPQNASTKSTYAGVQWINIPRPLRDAVTWGIDGLQHNRYGVPASAVDPVTPIGDIDDLADLDANEHVVCSQIRDIAFGWSDAGGHAIAVSGSVSSDVRCNGLYMDVVGPDNGLYPTADVASPAPGLAQYDYKADLARRPRIMRVAMGLYDAANGVAQDFSFSVASPGVPPAVVAPAP